MPRYIDPAKIDLRLPCGIDDGGEVLLPLSAVRAAIAQTPSKDVVEVVRCKDCEFYGENSLGVMFCTKPAGLVSTQRSNYCGYGKRKEQA